MASDWRYPAIGSAVGLAAMGPAGAFAGAVFGLLFEDDEGEGGDMSADRWTGTMFASEADKLPDDSSRQGLAVAQIEQGNVPSWTFDWKPVTWKRKDASGVERQVQVLVSPDYLSVGTDDDAIVAVIGFPKALEMLKSLAPRLLAEDLLLPTSLVVDQIWANAAHRYEPAPLPATSGSTMRRPGYWLDSRQKIQVQGWPAGSILQAGHKKDVVVSKQLVGTPGRLAIYGWHRSDGKPIQPVSLFHGADYADYSHGIRAVLPTVFIDGVEMDYRDVLADSTLWPLLSKEGPFSYEDATKVTGTWNMV